MRRHYFSYPLLLLLLLLAACNREDDQQIDTPPPAATATMPRRTTATATSAPTATATPSATPTPPQPAITVQAQTVDESGEIVVDSVTIPEAGWLVLYGDVDGVPDEVLDYVALEEGTTEDVVLSVDPYAVTDVVHLLLHRDQGTRGTFDASGLDEPYQGEGTNGATELTLQIDVPAPAIEVADQDVTTEGKIVAEKVIATTPGWLVLHADDGGDPGAILGQTPIAAGENQNVVVFFDWRQATRQLHALLYTDEGDVGMFEPEADDRRVAFRGENVEVAFVVDLPPDVFVIDQPATTGEVVVERAVINAPGWIAVYSDFNGFTDRLLGHAPLEAGVNEEITIPISDTTTSLLHIMLHEDTGELGEFEYPSSDPPLRDDQARARLFTFQTDGGNYIVTRDQPLGEDGSVAIPIVVADLDVWITVWSTVDGEPDAIIGRLLLAPGVHHDVRVGIDTDTVTDVLFVVLHQDAGEAGEFEYPVGPDEVLQHERNDIRAPFNLLAMP